MVCVSVGLLCYVRVVCYVVLYVGCLLRACCCVCACCVFVLFGLVFRCLLFVMLRFALVFRVCSLRVCFVDAVGFFFVCLHLGSCALCALLLMCCAVVCLCCVIYVCYLFV